MSPNDTACVKGYQKPETSLRTSWPLRQARERFLEIYSQIGFLLPQARQEETGLPPKRHAICKMRPNPPPSYQGFR